MARDLRFVDGPDLATVNDVLAESEVFAYRTAHRRRAIPTPVTQ